jgi:hypothetical protein
MHRHRKLPILLLAAALVAGCASEKAEQRRARAPLRDVFPPPSLEAPAAAAAPSAPAAAGAAPGAAGVAATAGAASIAGAAAVDAGAQDSASAAAAPPAASARAASEPQAPQAAAAATGTAAALKPPRDTGASERSLAPPALDAELPSAREAPMEEQLAPRSLAKEFEPAPAAAAAAAPPATSSQGTAARPAVAAAQPSTLSTAPSLAPAPRIVVSNSPALLVSISGKPAYGAIEGTKLQRVLNTPAFLIRGSNGKYYLSVYDGFMTASTLTGPWSVMKTPPAALVQAKARALTDGESDVLAGRPDSVTGERPTLRKGAPRIVVATQPTALVVIRGEPLYEPVDGTRLSRLSNTDARVFVNRPEDRTYVQIGERWYRAPSLKGPWEAVDPARLPEGLQEAAAAA